MPRRINHLLKWKRDAHVWVGDRRFRAYTVKLSPMVNVRIDQSRVPESTDWVLTITMETTFGGIALLADKTYSSLPTAKGAVCNYINRAVADLVRAKQVADGTAPQLKRPRVSK